MPDVVITELFPSLFLLHTAKPVAEHTSTYLLRRREGNILLAIKDDARVHAADLDAQGGVQHVLLGDRHHALPATVAFARAIGGRCSLNSALACLAPSAGSGPRSLA